MEGVALLSQRQEFRHDVSSPEALSETQVSPLGAGAQLHPDLGPQNVLISTWLTFRTTVGAASSASVLTRSLPPAREPGLVLRGILGWPAASVSDKPLKIPEGFSETLLAVSSENEREAPGVREFLARKHLLLLFFDVKQLLWSCFRSTFLLDITLREDPEIANSEHIAFVLRLPDSIENILASEDDFRKAYRERVPPDQRKFFTVLFHLPG
jgi:hypothetical protein